MQQHIAATRRLRPAAVAGLVIAFFLVFAVQARTERAPRCDGKHVSILGTPGNDVLVGTRHKDVIAGLGGDDIISGAGREDTICGGDGVDTVTYADSPVAVNVDLATGDATGEGRDHLLEIENVSGSAFA